ncbi:MAG: FAD-dependent oxidoreductase [Pseudomonadota bacterium]
MDRRKFLKTTGAGLAAITTGLAGVRPAKAQTSSSADVIVIGAGTFGAWTAYHLNQRGANVQLIDAYGPGNSRASSGGETRQMQADRVSRVYTQSAKDSYALWKRLEDESGVPIVLETGKLMLSTNDGNVGDAEAIIANHRTNDIPGAELLGPDELRYRWPQLYSDDLSWGLYTQGVAGSVMMARKGVETVAKQFVKNGGESLIAYCTPELDANNNVTRLRLQDDSVLQAGQYVFACGPWLGRLFPELLNTRLQVERRDVLFYGSPPGDDRFAYPNLPNWSVVGSGYYGFPDIESRGFKVAPYPDLNSINPDVDERIITPQSVKRGRHFLAHRFPGLAEMPITETRVCQVTHTVDYNFIADKHPGSDNVWIVGGGSGHGFKHGPAVGQYVAKRVLGQAVDSDFSDTFIAMKAEFG